MKKKKKKKKGSIVVITGSEKPKKKPKEIFITTSMDLGYMYINKRRSADGIYTLIEKDFQRAKQNILLQKRAEHGDGLLISKQPRNLSWKIGVISLKGIFPMLL